MCRERQQQLEELTKDLARIQEECDMLRSKLKALSKGKSVSEEYMAWKVRHCQTNLQQNWGLFTRRTSAELVSFGIELYYSTFVMHASNIPPSFCFSKKKKKMMVSQHFLPFTHCLENFGWQSYEIQIL